MSKRETSGDAKGYERGEKGFAHAPDDYKFMKPDYKKELLETDRPVGQIANVGDARGCKQEGY
jgi:hypothetical protein